MTDLKQLLQRVEAANGLDREIDEAIARAMNWVPSGVNASLWNANETKPEHWYSEAFGMPAYTSSIDAALALVERKLPEQSVAIFNYQAPRENDPRMKAWAAFGIAYWGAEYDHHASGATPALAIIATLLKALIAQEQP